MSPFSEEGELLERHKADILICRFCSWKAYCRWSSCTLNFSDELGLAQGVTFD